MQSWNAQQRKLFLSEVNNRNNNSSYWGKQWHYCLQKWIEKFPLGMFCPTNTQAGDISAKHISIILLSGGVSELVFNNQLVMWQNELHSMIDVLASVCICPTFNCVQTVSWIYTRHRRCEQEKLQYVVPSNIK